MTEETSTDTHADADGPDDEPFMRATYRALCAHGFADVTTQDIADESDRSKASLHYHYDGKEDLFRQFLEHLFDEYESLTADPPGETPTERLVGLLRTVLVTDEEADTRFVTAFLEIKAQAPYRDGFRERLVRFDDRARERVATLVREGVEAGEFPPDTDPEAVASFLTTYLHGIWARSVVAEEDVAAMRERLVGYVLDLLVADATVDRSVGLPDDRLPTTAGGEAEGGERDRDGRAAE